MNKQEILDEIYKYIGNGNARYAIMITGEWGSGKTYLYDEFLEEEINKVIAGKDEKTVSAYISLYGIKTVEQLSKELLTNYLLKAKLYVDETKGKIYKVTSGIVGVVSKAFSLSISAGGGDTSVDFSKIIEGIGEKIDIKRMFICLDDLERCSIPINELFGFINNLVEHCECKVLLLADEENIGKMYANSNIEMKYNTLLMGRKLVDGPANEVTQKPEEKNEKITIEAIKKLNEKVYSENYIYKDIKEKVIGVTMKYVPNLNEDIEKIITRAVGNGGYGTYLIERKEKIVKYMLKCRNKNIRIIRNWLIKFEQIYNAVDNNFSSSKYYEDIMDDFMIYSIRVSCAVGKNKKLMDWNSEAEVGTVRIDDDFLFHAQGYRFIDVLYKDSLFDEAMLCKAVRYIESQHIEMEEKREKDNKKYSTGEILSELNSWKLYEDSEIKKKIEDLITEIENDKYIPQSYQNILRILIELKEEELCKSKEIDRVQQIMLAKIEKADEKIEVENFNKNIENSTIYNEYHTYYDPVYKKIIDKNRQIDGAEINSILQRVVNGEDISLFVEYCRENNQVFILRRAFMSYMDLDLLMACIDKMDVAGIYEIDRAIQSVYDFVNLYEYYTDDISCLEQLCEKIKKLESHQRTRKIAYDCLVATLEKVLEIIKWES